MYKYTIVLILFLTIVAISNSAPSATTSVSVTIVGATFPYVTITTPSNNSQFTNQSIQFNITVIDNFSTSLTCSMYVDSSIANVPCYQETATVATACGGLSTGNYSFGNSTVWTDPLNLYDENWSTFGYGKNCAMACDPADIEASTFYANYTIPTNATSADWIVKDGVGTVILPIPAGCFIPPKLILKVQSYEGHGFIGDEYNSIWSCWDGVGWTDLRTNFAIGTPAYFYIYEEKILWHGFNSTSFTAQNNTPTIFNGSVPDGYHNVSFSCTNGLNLSNTSENTSLLVASQPPIITYLFPPSGASGSTINQTFSFKATHNVFPKVKCTIHTFECLDWPICATPDPATYSNLSNASTQNNTLTSLTFASLSATGHGWYVDCMDSLGNTGTSITSNIILSVPGPVQPPSGGGPTSINTCSSTCPTDYTQGAYPDCSCTAPPIEQPLSAKTVIDIAQSIIPEVKSIPFSCEPTIERNFPIVGADLLDGLGCNSKGLLSLYVESLGEGINFAFILLIILIAAVLNTKGKLQIVLTALIGLVIFIGFDFLTFTATASLLAFKNGYELFAQTLHDLLG